jgi:hypothetical protein
MLCLKKPKPDLNSGRISDGMNDDLLFKKSIEVVLLCLELQWDEIYCFSV